MDSVPHSAMIVNIQILIYYKYDFFLNTFQFTIVIGHCTNLRLIRHVRNFFFFKIGIFSNFYIFRGTETSQTIPPRNIKISGGQRLAVCLRHRITKTRNNLNYSKNRLPTISTTM